MKKIMGITGLISALYFTGCENDHKLLIQRCENENIRIDATIKPGILFDDRKLEFYQILPSGETRYMGEASLDSMNGYFYCKDNRIMTIRLGSLFIGTKNREQ